MLVRMSRKTGTLFHSWWISDWYNHSEKQSGASSENWTLNYLRTQLYLKGTCSTMFNAALCIIARSWKEPRCPSTEE